MSIEEFLKDGETLEECVARNREDADLALGLLAKAIYRRESDHEVLQRIMQVLGPHSACECDGCQYEQNEAIRLLNSMGIIYQDRKERRQAHNKEAERRGNELSILDQQSDPARWPPESPTEQGEKINPYPGKRPMESE